MGKVPEDAFEKYVSMGAGRSYQALADSVGCSKTAITNRATKDCWQERLLAIEEGARYRVEQELADSAAIMTVRHVTSARRLLDKALVGLEEIKVETVGDVVRLIDCAVRVERLSREAPTSRVALEVEKIATPFLEAHHSGARRELRN